MRPDTDTLAAVLAARSDDDGRALWFEERSWTWREAVGEMRMRADALHTRLAGAIPHFAVLLDNVPEYLFLLGGAALSGTVLVGLNTTRRGEELRRDVLHTDCALVVTDDEHAPLLAGLDLGDVEVLRAGELQAAEVPPTTTVTDAADLLLLIFTSGTSGAPKAVRISHARAMRAASGAMGFSPDDALYCAMPLFHGNALMSSVFPAMGTGASIVLKRRFSASAFLDDVRTHGCTFFSTVGRALSYILATPPTDHDREHNLKFVLAPESSPVDVKRFGKRFGVYVVTGYGSSENAIVMAPRRGLPANALGVPLEGLDCAVVDPETAEECPRAHFDASGRLLNGDEAIGELVGKNALGNFEGYYNNLEATEARSRNGWYWSGDLAYRDTDGVFYFAGRSSDWLRVDGENFGAAPVERVLERFPGVTGVAVYGVPDERTVDDQVMATLEMADGATFDPVAFDAFLDAQADLGTKWAPRYVRIVPELPVGATGKVDTMRLRRERWIVSDELYWRPDRKGPLEAMTGDATEELHRRFDTNGRASALS
jgi:fatty-acyl-CoA synthase